MKPTIWIFSIEPLETRYTAQWHKYFPILLEDTLGSDFNIVQVDGIQRETETSQGAFLNFADTNYWKSSQLCNFLDLHSKGKTSTDDKFIFTDAWNTSILQLKYISDLLGYNWQIHGLFHAGSWDKQDFLGRSMGSSAWVKHTEKALFHALDFSYFATNFHIRMFVDGILDEKDLSHASNNSIIRSGWPMEYLYAELEPFKNAKKQDIILFPHRKAPEKQLEIFLDLKSRLTEYEFVVCQDKKLSKQEYHELLARSKIVFSANLQETLGISSCAEGPLMECIPLCPDRLSYTEIFDEYPEFLYPSHWTEDWNCYEHNRASVIKLIRNAIENYDSILPSVKRYNRRTYVEYFHSGELLTRLIN